MAVKNLQTLALCVANTNGVRVTGTECKDMMPASGTIPAHLLSLLWQPLPGPYPIRTGPDAELAEDNTRAAQAVRRAGRSASEAGIPVSTGLRWFARTVSRTVLSKRSSSSSMSFAPSHRFPEDCQSSQASMHGSTRQQPWLANHDAKLVRG